MDPDPGKPLPYWSQIFWRVEKRASCRVNNEGHDCRPQARQLREREANLFQDKLVFLLQQFVVRVDKVQVILWCGVINSPQLLQECFTVHADSLMHKHHMVHNIFTVLIGYLVVLEKR